MRQHGSEMSKIREITAKKIESVRRSVFGDFKGKFLLLVFDGDSKRNSEELGRAKFVLQENDFTRGLDIRTILTADGAPGRRDVYYLNKDDEFSLTDPEGSADKLLWTAKNKPMVEIDWPTFVEDIIEGIKLDHRREKEQLEQEFGADLFNIREETVRQSVARQSASRSNTRSPSN